MSENALPSSAAPSAHSHGILRVLQGRTLRLAQVVWWLLFALVITITLLAVPANLAFLRAICVGAACAPEQITQAEVQSLNVLGITLDTYLVFNVIINLLPMLVYLTVAFILFIRKANDSMVYFTSLTLMLFGGITYPNFIRQFAALQPVWSIPYLVLSYLGSIFLVTFFFIFPSGTFVPRWIWVLLVFWMVEEFIDIASGPPLNLGLEPLWLSNSSLALIFLSALFAQIYRYRRVSGARQQQQTQWVVFGISIALASIVLLALLAISPFVTHDQILLALFLNTLLVLAIVAIPASIGIAILRSRLYDIELLINRTLVYGLLTPILAGVFAAVSSLSQKLFVSATGQPSEIAAPLATVIVVALFAPIRKRVEKFVDARFKYSSPHFGELGAKIRDHVELSDPAALLKKFLHEALHTLDAPAGAIYLGAGEHPELIEQVGPSLGADALSVPLTYNDKQSGLIVLAPREHGHLYNKQERASLEHMAQLVAHSIQLSTNF